MRIESDIYIDVLGLGSVTVDFVGTVKAWPDRGVKRMLDSFVICDGGLVGTALVAAATLLKCSRLCGVSRNRL